MGELKPNMAASIHKIRDVFVHGWDPIGIGTIADWPQDEYDWESIAQIRPHVHQYCGVASDEDIFAALRQLHQDRLVEIMKVPEQASDIFQTHPEACWFGMTNAGRKLGIQKAQSIVMTNRSNQPLQPTALWRCASMSILISLFSVGAQPRSQSGG